jgi:light-regulated signal transduction histidine kinase (bacteriophytochrome)
MTGVQSGINQQYLLAITDITSRKNTEDELKMKIKELDDTNQKLEMYVYANQELSQFSYIASHQLQEPIRTVSNFMTIMSEDYNNVLDNKALGYINIVKDATKRMAILINTLLDYSQLGRNKKLTYVNCNDLILNVISDIRFLLDAKDVSIEVSELPTLFLFKTEIIQLFQNLITNAVKFQEPGNKPKIQIWSEKQNGTWIFLVKDNGIGILSAHFDKVFQIFQRLHYNEEAYEGKGIGLAYCKKIVQMHQGKIWIESEQGKGTTVHFTIPELLE